MKSKLYVILLAASYSLSAYANITQEICDRHFNQNDNVAHCAYLSGLSPYDPKDGRYIKIYDPNLNLARVSCSADNNIELMLDADTSLEYYFNYGLTNRTRQYYICTDATGSSCELVGSDSFSVLKNENKYTSEPKSYAVNLSLVKDKYPACNKWRS
jgi:hypothetical protein